MQNISNPINKTYYVLWNTNDTKDKYHIGYIETDQTLQSGKEHMLTFDKKEDWEKELVKLEIDIPEENI